MGKRPDLRPTIELSTKFLQILEEAIQNHQGVRAALIGVYEGRQLKGNYRLRLLRCSLEPVPDVEGESRNDH